MAEVFSISKKTAVYYRMGMFPDSTPKFQLAPFAILSLPGGQYLVPVNRKVDGTAHNQTAVMLADPDANVQIRDDFGYETCNNLFVLEAEMGCKDDSTSWKGMHSFGRW